LVIQTDSGVEISIRVIPRARKTALSGTRGNALLVRLAAPPVDGAANASLIDWMARLLHVPASSVRIVAGERSRDKRVAIAGATAERVKRALNL